MLTFSDGDELITRINGDDDEVLAHYAQNNALTYTGDGDEGYRDKNDPIVSSVKFLDSGRVVSFGPLPAHA